METRQKCVIPTSSQKQRSSTVIRDKRLRLKSLFSIFTYVPTKPSENIHVITVTCSRDSLRYLYVKHGLTVKNINDHAYLFSAAVVSGQCEGPECIGGCCPVADWVCCDDPLYCAETLADCGGDGRGRAQDSTEWCKVTRKLMSLLTTKVTATTMASLRSRLQSLVVAHYIGYTAQSRCQNHAISFRQ